MLRSTAALVVFLALAVQLPSQESSSQTAPAEGRRPIGMALTAEGSRITIFRDGAERSVDPNRTAVAGTPLQPGTLLQLEPGTSIELQFLPGTARLKASSLSTIRIDAVEPSGGAELTVYYGRLRIVVPSAVAGSVILDAPRARISVEPGSDVALDVLADPQDGSTFAAVSTIAGGARVASRSAPEDAEPIRVEPGTSVRAGPGAGDDEQPGVQFQASPELAPGVAAHWSRLSFEADPKDGETIETRFPEAFAFVSGFYAQAPAVAEAPPPPDEPEPEPEPAAAPVDIEPLPLLPELDLTPPEFAQRDRTDLRNGGFGLMAMGAFFAGAGVGVDYAVNNMLSENIQPQGVSPGVVLMYAGGGFFVSGVVSFLISQF